MSKLALLGGEKAVKDSSNLVASVPLVPEKAYPVINDMLKKGEISTSPVVEEFEDRFKKYIGAKYALTVPNGTTSIMTALFAAGIQPGDEVIVPSFTFWASAGPIAAINAVPVFADVDLLSHNMTAEFIEKKITDKTKAIIIVHVWGTPAELDPIIALSKKYNLKLIEDCSHAHGATYHGKKVGMFGDIGCFSLQGSKTLPAGEGGILVTNNREMFERACALGHYERLASLGEGSNYSKYSLTGFGFKHRIHPVAAAIANAGLDTLDELNALRNKNAKYLEALINDLEYITVQKTAFQSERSYSYHFVKYNPEKLLGINLNTVLKAISAEGVTCGSCGYGKLHKAPFYTEKGPYDNCFPFGEAYIPSSDLHNTEILSETVFMIAPRFETQCDEHIKQYALAYHKILENAEELKKYELDNNLSDVKITNKGRSINLYN